MAPSESPEESAGRHESDLYVRPGWVDADVALRQVDQVRHNVNMSEPPPRGGRGNRRATPSKSGVIDDFGARPDRGLVGDVPCYASLGGTTEIAACVVHS